MKDKLANKTDKRVFVKADARAKYGAVVEVVDNVRSAGVDQLGLLTEQRKHGSVRLRHRPGRRRPQVRRISLCQWQLAEAGADPRQTST